MEISALIEDAKEPSSADCSLIYKEKEDGGDADGDPYKLKLLCSSDGSVNIEDKEGKLSLSAQKWNLGMAWNGKGPGPGRE